MNADLHLTGPFGEQISVHTDGDILAALRQYGRQGYVSGELVRGGITLPYDNEHDFDWDLIGARPYTKPDGTIGIYCRGHFWTRREFEAVDNKKMSMPAAIRYSRGAKPTDPDHLKEKSDGEIEYVGLVTFKGGKRQEKWAKQSGPAESRQKVTDTAAPTAPVMTAEKARTAYAALTKGTRYYSADGVAEVLAACLNSLYPSRQNNPATMKEAFESGDTTLITLILNTAQAWIAEDDAQAVAS